MELPRNRAPRVLRLAVATLALAAFSAGTFAQISAEQQSAIRGNCRSDFLSNCSGVPRGGKEALDCLRQHMAKLSPACASAVQAVTPPPAATAPPAPPPPPPPATKTAPPPAAAAPPPAAAAPPPPPAATPAPKKAAPPPPKAAAPKVEKRKAPELAPAAAAPAPIPLDKIEALPLSKRLTISRHCRADIDAVCPSVKRGGGRIIACLATHRSALSPPCRQALEKELQ